jgi:hypothetical protein
MNESRKNSFDEQWLNIHINAQSLINFTRVNFLILPKKNNRLKQKTAEVFSSGLMAF